MAARAQGWAVVADGASVVLARTARGGVVAVGTKGGRPWAVPVDGGDG